MDDMSGSDKLEALIFDIDGTLTRSKLPLDDLMASLLCRLLDKYIVAIISGANFEQFKWQILDRLQCGGEKLKKLVLMPTDGTVFCTYRDKDGWICESDPPLSPEEKQRIRNAFNEVFYEAGVEKPVQLFGEQIEDRGAQLNFSALGQHAPIETKERWDPDNKKREKLVRSLERHLKGFSFRIGGTTSIEITRLGVDKAYGLKKFMEKMNFSPDRILYLGDKFFEGGNDYPVLKLGIKCRAVKDVEDTRLFIISLLK